MKSKTVPGFERNVDVPRICYHTFETSKDGQLLHLIDNTLRATIPPEGWADYVKEWPEAGDIVDALRIVPAAAQATTSSSIDLMLDQASQIAALQAELATLKPAAEVTA
jgi:hypothetical protein